MGDICNYWSSKIVFLETLAGARSCIFGDPSEDPKLYFWGPGIVLLEPLLRSGSDPTLYGASPIQSGRSDLLIDPDPEAEGSHREAACP